MAQVGDEQDDGKGGEDTETAPGSVDCILQLLDGVLPALIQAPAPRLGERVRAKELAVFRVGLSICKVVVRVLVSVEGSGLLGSSRYTHFR